MGVDRVEFFIGGHIHNFYRGLGIDIELDTNILLAFLANLLYVEIRSHQIKNQHEKNQQ